MITVTTTSEFSKFFCLAPSGIYSDVEGLDCSIEYVNGKPKIFNCSDVDSINFIDNIPEKIPFNFNVKINGKLVDNAFYAYRIIKAYNNDERLIYDKMFRTSKTFLESCGFSMLPNDVITIYKYDNLNKYFKNIKNECDKLGLVFKGIIGEFDDSDYKTLLKDKGQIYFNGEIND